MEFINTGGVPFDDDNRYEDSFDSNISGEYGHSMNMDSPQDWANRSQMYDISDFEDSESNIINFTFFNYFFEQQ